MAHRKPKNQTPITTAVATPVQKTSPGSLPPLPEGAPRSSVNLYELSFGTVAGICAGVFIKKGAKALAFTFGGIFVLLQVCSDLVSAFNAANPPLLHYVVSGFQVHNQGQLGECFVQV